MRSVLIAASLLALVARSPAQEDLNVSSSSQHGRIGYGWLRLSGIPSHAEVFVDSTFIGRTPLDQYRLTEGRHQLRVVYPSASSWNAVWAAETIDVSSGVTTEKRYELGTVFALRSVPAGARVAHLEEELGTTPLYYHSPSRLGGDLTLSKDGFDRFTLSLADSLLSSPIRLKPKQTPDGSSIPEIILSSSVVGQRDNWLTIGAGSAMLVTGVLAAYLKDRANNRFDEYVRTRDESFLMSTRRLDRQSLAALIVSELSFALLTYLLLVE